MNTIPRRIASLGLVSAAATFALAAPATAGPIPPDPIPQHSGQGVIPTRASSDLARGTTVTTSGTEWAQVGYGAAGGVALAAVGAAGVVMLRRRQHLPHHA
jgi:hypothetical protein